MGLLVEIDVLGHITHGIDHFFPLVKVDSILAVVAEFHCSAYFKVAAVGPQLVEQQLDKG